MKRLLFLTVVLAVALVLLIALGAQFVFGAPSAREQPAASAVPRGLGQDWVVTSTADSGHGSLRWALQSAEAGDTIVLPSHVFPPSSPATVSLVSELPHITQGNLTVDGSSAGVILDGSALSSGDGFHITSDGNAIKGLQVLNFPGNGIRIGDGGSHNTIGGSNASAGGACTGECNLISGNGSSGVWIEGSDTMSNTVSGNYIGTDASGTLALPNGDNGVAISQGASHNLIGGSTVTEGNIIAHNDVYGAHVWGASTLSNTISHNSIHSNADKGIELTDGGNLELPTPVIVTVTIDLISGSTVNGTACASCTVEVFTDDVDEGRTFWGSATADVSGDFTFTGDLRGAYVTATSTDAAGNTSEFSSPAALLPQRIHLPIVLKSH